MTASPIAPVARPRGRRPSSSPSGRAALLLAATHAFAELGFERADLRSIARSADVDVGLVRIHFGDKAELWRACLDAVAAEATPVIAAVTTLAADSSRPVYDRLRQAIETFVAFGVAHPEVRQFVAQHAAETPERAGLLIERLARPAYQSIHALIEAGIACGVVRTSHPALFFSLLSNAVNQPRAVPALLHAIAPEIDVGEVPPLLAQSIVATFLHPLHLPDPSEHQVSSQDIK